mgnify:CR=1 FL=1
MVSIFTTEAITWVERCLKCWEQEIIPSQNRTEYWKFLIAIKSISDGNVIHGIESYYQGGHVNKGKGFPYLRTIIQTIGKDSEAIRELERRRIGGVPPIIKIEERQWKQTYKT